MAGIPDLLDGSFANGAALLLTHFLRGFTRSYTQALRNNSLSEKQCPPRETADTVFLCFSIMEHCCPRQKRKSMNYCGLPSQQWKRVWQRQQKQMRFAFYAIRPALKAVGSRKKYLFRSGYKENTNAKNMGNSSDSRSAKLQCRLIALKKNLVFVYWEQKIKGKKKAA